MNKRKRIKFFTVLSVFSATVLFCTAAVVKALTNPSIYSIDRPFSDNIQHGVTYAQGIGLSLNVKTTGDATYANANWLGNWKTDLSKGSTSGGYTTWTGSWNPQASDFRPGVYDQNSPWPYYKKTNNIVFRVGNSNYSTIAERTGYVSALKLNDYQNLASKDNFWYSNEADNYFYGAATNSPVGSYWGTYNCLSYAIDVYDRWINPPTYISDVDSFMLGSGIYAGRIGTKYTQSSTSPMQGTKAIYYEGDHFAKVYTWDSNGYPNGIISKWGSLELIRSGKIDPFTSINNTTLRYSNGDIIKGYGKPIKYYR